MLLGAMLLWALNVTVSKFILEHGWQPLAYGTIRYFAAIALFAAFTYSRERSFYIARSDLKLVLLAAGTIFVNQLCFIYGLRFGQASTLSLLFGTTPIFVGVIGMALKHGRLQRSFWAGAALTLLGVALVGLSEGRVSADYRAIFLGISTGLTWACYTIAIAPLMERYSPYRISVVVLGIGWIPLALISIPQLSSQSFSFGWKVWLAFGYAVVGPLFLTNILWFTAVSIVGAPRAALFNNLQPFFGVLFAILLLSEKLRPLEAAGGVLILVGIAFERIRRRPLTNAVTRGGNAPEADVCEPIGSP
jgi:drug/metabolite transporter (DMT)-like permease